MSFIFTDSRAMLRQVMRIHVVKSRVQVRMASLDFSLQVCNQTQC